MPCCQLISPQSTPLRVFCPTVHKGSALCGFFLAHIAAACIHIPQQWRLQQQTTRAQATHPVQSKTQCQVLDRLAHLSCSVSPVRRCTSRISYILWLHVEHNREIHDRPQGEYEGTFQHQGGSLKSQLCNSHMRAQMLVTQDTTWNSCCSLCPHGARKATHCMCSAFIVGTMF